MFKENFSEQKIYQPEELQVKIREKIAKEAMDRCHYRYCDIIVRDPAILDRLADIRSHDEKTFDHSLAVANIMAYVINQLKDKLAENEAYFLMRSSLLHDYGKIGTDPAILNKTKQLENSEKLSLKDHPLIGHAMLDDEPDTVRNLVGTHHLYQKDAYGLDPKDILNREQVEKLSKVLSAVDSFQAMIDENRPSNAGGTKTIQEIINELNQDFIKDQDNALVLETIMLLEGYYYELSDQQKKLRHSQDFDTLGHA